MTAFPPKAFDERKVVTIDSTVVKGIPLVLMVTKATVAEVVIEI